MPEVPEFLRVVRRHKSILMIAFVLPVLVAIGVTEITEPTDQARAEVLFRTQPADPLDQQSGNQSATRTLNNEILQMKSAVVRDVVRKAYSGALDPSIVTVDAASTDADVIVLTATAHDANAAALLVNTYVDSYTNYRRDSETNALLAAGLLARQKADELTKQIDAANAPLTALDAKIATATGDELTRTREQRQQLASQIESQLRPVRDQLAFYQEQIDRVELSAGIRKAGSLVLLRAATAPAQPISPDPVRNVAWGIALGVVLGLGAAFLRETFDDTISDRVIVEELAQTPLVGTIPRVGRSRGNTGQDLEIVTDPNSSASEAFRMLRTSVKFMRVNQRVRVIEVTSAVSDEGKTFVASNLAAALAESGERVVVVGCDLRRAGLDRLAGIEGGPGFTSVLLGEISLELALVEHPDVANLYVLRTGPLPPRPAELLGGSRAASVFKTLAETFDWVILDCSPVLPVTDALVAARCADAVLIVASQGSSSRRAFQRAVEMLRQIDAPLLTPVLNRGTDEVRAYGGVYETERPKQRRKRRSKAQTPKPSRPSDDRDDTYRPYDAYDESQRQAREILEQAEKRLDLIVSAEQPQQADDDDMPTSARWRQREDEPALEALLVKETDQRTTTFDRFPMGRDSDATRVRNGTHAKDLSE